MRLQRQVPLGPDGIEVKPGEQLIVKGDVYGDIEAENSHVRVKGDVFGGVDPHIPYVKVTIDGHSHDSSQDKQRAKTPPTDVSKSTPDEGKVEVVTLIQSSIQKDYGNYLIVYTHSFRKLIKGQRDSVKPTEKEVTQFMHDVAEAAENNREVAIFVAANPNMRF